MAIFAGLVGIIGRFARKLLTTLLGWASTLLFGKVPADKQLIIAPTAGHGATCYSCANCPWMAMNELESLATVFDRGENEVFVDPELGRRAMLPLQRMLDFRKNNM